MRCEDLKLGQRSACVRFSKNRYQQVVFINKNDVDSFQIKSSLEIISEGLEPTANHFIKFKLKEGKKGFRFSIYETANIIKADFSKSENLGITRYTHNVSFPIYGVSQHQKKILEQFDKSSDYFACLMHYSGIVEVFGFDFGFKTNDYTFESDVVLELESTEPEYKIPLVYKSRIKGMESDEFNNDFEAINYDNEYNFDYNKDFTS